MEQDDVQLDALLRLKATVSQPNASTLAESAELAV
jgi:hypothetical protein